MDIVSGATHHQEVSYSRPLHRKIETFQRPSDSYEAARKFNAETTSRPLDGRAKSYLTLGPWIKIRLLRMTIHFIRKGSPPHRAYVVLAKHIFSQIKHSKQPRLLIKRGKNKRIVTVGGSDHLKNTSIVELTTMVKSALGKRSRHMIYRQNNVGGPLFDFAAQHDALY